MCKRRIFVLRAHAQMQSIGNDGITIRVPNIDFTDAREVPAAARRIRSALIEISHM